MRPSPLQLRHVLYTKVSVLGNPSVDKERPMRAAGFDFNGVNIKAKVGVGQKEGQDEDPRDFVVNLEITIDGKEGNPAPYLVDIAVVGVFNVLSTLARERRRDLVTVNGASILYGVVREVVLSLTSRFSTGPMTLPGMNFEDTVLSGSPIPSGKSTPKTEKLPSVRKARKASKKA